MENFGIAININSQFWHKGFEGVCMTLICLRYYPPDHTVMRQAMEPLFATSIANPTQARSHYGYVRGLGLFLFNAPAETEGRRAISLLTDWRVDDASGVP